MAEARNGSDVARLKQQALALASRPSKSFHAFARALWAVHRGDPSFLHEVERVSGLKRRALFYLSNVGAFLHGYDISGEQAERIGWTKLQIIARYVRQQEKESKGRKPAGKRIEAILHIARHTTVHALPEALRAGNTETGEPLRSVLLRLPADHYGEIEAALLAWGAKKRGRGLVDKEKALLELVRALGVPQRQRSRPRMPPEAGTRHRDENATESASGT